MEQYKTTIQLDLETIEWIKKIGLALVNKDNLYSNEYKEERPILFDSIDYFLKNIKYDKESFGAIKPLFIKNINKTKPRKLFITMDEEIKSKINFFQFNYNQKLGVKLKFNQTLKMIVFQYYNYINDKKTESKEIIPSDKPSKSNQHFRAIIIPKEYKKALKKLQNEKGKKIHELVADALNHSYPNLLMK